MAKPSRNTQQTALWNDINVRLLPHVQLVGNKRKLILLLLRFILF
jgi:hypothetical protein